MNALVHHHRRSIAIIAFLFIQLQSFGQLKAGFSATPVAGCAPIVVNFTDQSTGTPTQWKWDLGNGVTSFLQNPSATYFNPGTYNIKLVVKNSSGADSLTQNQLITVYANPVVNFSASDTMGCFPLNVRFTDISTPGAGTITSWNWDFGDGNVSTATNPTHTYQASGNYTVTLNVTNSFGCTKTYTKSQYIKISNGVKADFNFTSTPLCSLPVLVNFSNTTTGTGAITYNWNFGDGAVSTAQNPSHTYATAGSYTIELVAVSPQGCTDTIRKTNVLTVGSASVSQFTVPAKLCAEASLNFTNTTNPAPISSLWSFGDGTTSTDINPVKSYATGGTYTIKLVNNFGTCVDSVTKTITVLSKPQPNLSVNITSSCSLPATVQFTDLTPGNHTVLWNFGDGGSSSQLNPSHTYTTEGNFTITLIVNDQNGCSNSLLKHSLIQIKKPGINIQGLPRKGCAPVIINPTATVSAGQTITSYLWNFGDGTTSTSATPTHSYTNAGNYTVTLAVNTTSGCSDSIVVASAVRVGNKPTANFNINPKEVCAFETVSFRDTSSGNPDQWFWQFGDGGTSVEQHPLYQYSDTGWFDVKLIIWNNTCVDSIEFKRAVHIKPPIAAFDEKFDCKTRYTREFIDRSIAPETWYWEFGDGTTSTLKNPVHTYTAAGNYTVTLTVTNGSCSHSTTHPVSIIDEKAKYVADTTICKNADELFTSTGINASNVTNWFWDFGNGTSSVSPMQASNVYATSGTYNTSLNIVDLNGCEDSSFLQIKVYGPTADFQASGSNICLSQNKIFFADSSASDGVNPIVKWIWNYGDGAIDSTSTAPYSHSYNGTGSYDVTLTVVDNFGCTNQLSKPASINIIQPVASFTTLDTSTCIGKDVVFINSSTGLNLQYQWQFGDGSQAVTSNPVHSYNTVGKYTVQLVATDQNGCSDTATKADYISITYPSAKFIASDTFATCPPLMVNFTNQSNSYTNLRWDFGDGTSSSVAEPSHFYTTPGIYYAVLIATGPGGCQDTVRQRIEIKGPIGSFSYAPLVGCNPLTVNFTAVTQNTSSLVWDFSDGNTKPTTNSTVSHVYTAIGDYIPKLILVDTGGCTIPIMGIDTISVKGLNAGFTLSANQFCNSGDVQFTNTTVGNDYITGYQWSFGDGTTSTAQHPSHSYSAPGMYAIQLIATSQYGCKDTVLMNDTVKVFQKPVIRIDGDSAACIPATFNYYGVALVGDSSKMAWQWTLANGDTSLRQNPLPQSFTSATSQIITATVTDENGCKDTATKAIELYPIPDTKANADAWICRGSFIQLNATGAATYQWAPTTSLSCTNCANPLAAPVDSTQYIVTGTNSYGCSTQDSVIIKVHQPFVLKVEPGDTICVGKTVRLEASGADTYTWLPATGVVDPTKPSTSATPQVSTLYNVIAKDTNNCFVDTASVYIKVWPIPTVDAGADKNLIVGQSVQLTTTNSSDVSSWQWSPGSTLNCGTCPNPKANPRQQTTYDVLVKNDGGCSNNSKVTIFVICNNGNVFIPNTFSPNADGTNDRFYPRGSGIASIKLLRIFNRWGEVVFERQSFNANDAAAGWDGTYKGLSLPPDVYVYTCEVICQNYEVLSFKGDVTLLR